MYRVIPRAAHELLDHGCTLGTIRQARGRRRRPDRVALLQ